MSHSRRAVAALPSSLLSNANDLDLCRIYSTEVDFEPPSAGLALNDESALLVHASDEVAKCVVNHEVNRAD